MPSRPCRPGLGWTIVPKIKKEDRRTWRGGVTWFCEVGRAVSRETRGTWPLLGILGTRLSPPSRGGGEGLRLGVTSFVFQGPLICLLFEEAGVERTFSGCHLGHSLSGTQGPGGSSFPQKPPAWSHLAGAAAGARGGTTGEAATGEPSASDPGC
jgi:hypothetical protein